MKTFFTYCFAAIMVMSIAATGKAAPPPGMPVPTVVTEQVAPTASKSFRRHVGTVEAINCVQIIPRITGELRKINFREGSLVKAGQLLYEIEDTTYKAAVQGLEAQLEAQRATVAYAKTEHIRKSRLLESNAVSTSSHELAVMEINIAKANIKRLEAALIDARNTLSYTKIISPISGRIGKLMTYVMAPIGFDWRLSTASIGALAAKEVFVSQLGILFAQGETDEESESLREILVRNYTPLQAFCVMIFCLLSIPCLATLAIIKRELNSWKMAFIEAGGLFLLAYVVTFVVYHLGNLLNIGNKLL